MNECQLLLKIKNELNNNAIKLLREHKKCVDGKVKSIDQSYIDHVFHWMCGMVVDIEKFLNENEWKPIDTAPKDGSVIRGGEYDNNGNWNEYDCYYRRVSNRLHWLSNFGIIKNPQYWIEKHKYQNPPEREEEKIKYTSTYLQKEVK